MSSVFKISVDSVSRSRPSRSIVLSHAANELVFAVVGHVGSGTSQIAKTLKALLENPSLHGGKYDVILLKATEAISEWATKNKRPVPDRKPKTLSSVRAFQDLGDEMRADGDYAAVAKSLALLIRRKRAEVQSKDVAGDEPIQPDGTKRAYILDSIRHPAEVELLRHIYQDAFFLIGVVCEEQKRLDRVTKKYEDAGQQQALTFMRRDARAKEKYGRRVSDAFHLSDFFLDNTTDQFRSDHSPNPDWDMNERLSRFIKIINHQIIVRPEDSETAMYYASGASLRSACLSRQVGAALLDKEGNIVATGTNEVPKAGGGVYGEGFRSNAEDHRCAYRRLDGKDPYCSNTAEQNVIAEKVVGDIGLVVPVPEDKKSELQDAILDGRVGDLLEFSRAVHAEMDALLTAGRKAVSTIGTRLFVTTFPCHYCARHIVAAGIDEVQYIEPYPKSQALSLHADSIQSEAINWTPPSVKVMNEELHPDSEEQNAKVLFRPFSGIAPRLYRRAFAKDRDLKNDRTGILEIGEPQWGAPWHLRKASYVQLEAELSREV